MALICENPKTTEPILQVEFELVKKFLYYNSDSFSPSFRQCVISSLKKVEFILVLKDVKKKFFFRNFIFQLFNRFKESWIYQAKLLSKARNKKLFKIDLDLTSVEQAFLDLHNLYQV